MLLVDTYDTLKSGILMRLPSSRNLREKGDMNRWAYASILGTWPIFQSRLVKSMQDLPMHGFSHRAILMNNHCGPQTAGAKIDVWGVGTRLITGHDHPALGGVYKLSANVENGQIVPKLKVSENVWRLHQSRYQEGGTYL